MKLALSLALALIAVPAVQADPKSDFQKLYNDLAAAIKKKDLKGSMAFLAPDYVDTDVKGKKMTRKEFEKVVSDQFKAPFKVTTFDIKVTKVTSKGAEFIVENTGKLVLTIPNPQTKKDSKLEQNSTSKDVWVKSGAKWLLKSSVTTSQKRYFDGKEVKG